MTAFAWPIPTGAERPNTATPTRNAIETTVGRVIFSEIWPEEMGFLNRVAGKAMLGELIWTCYKICGHEKTVVMLDSLKELGFRSATRSGCSIGIDDMIIPKEKDQEIRNAQKQISDVEKQYRKGVITPGERYNKVIDIWTHCTDQIANVMLRTLEFNHGKLEYNPVSLMVDSGARGNRQQVRQLAGVRGLMAKPSGDIIEKPILSNFREGLTVLEYFISTHGARKGLADTALKTADSGYMTRKLVDVAQDVIIRMEDCGTSNGIWVQAIYEGEDEVVKLSERIIGRIACDDIVDPGNVKNVLVQANELIDEVKARADRSQRRREAPHPLRPHLRKQARHLRQLLWPQPGHRRHDQTRRSRRHHCRPIHRRAGHPVDHAHLPHRRHRLPGLQTAADQVQVRRHCPLQRPSPGRAGGRQQHRPQQERLHFHSRRRRPRTGSPHPGHRLRHFRQERRQRVKKGEPSSNGTPTTSPSSPKKPGA